jgi:IS5 family transposase
LRGDTAWRSACSSLGEGRRSRGGRNTKIHAIADAKGRLLSLMLTDGAAHDCPAAKPLIERKKAAKRLLGDKAYDSAELRGWLKRRGTRAVIPNRSNRKLPFSFSKAIVPRKTPYRECILSAERLPTYLYPL